MSKLNVGVLGLSHDHVWGNLGALATGELGRVTAAAEPDPELRARLRGLHGGVEIHESFDALLERRDLDAVIDLQRQPDLRRARRARARPSAARDDREAHGGGPRRRRDDAVGRPAARRAAHGQLADRLAAGAAVRADAGGRGRGRRSDPGRVIAAATPAPASSAARRSSASGSTTPSATAAARSSTTVATARCSAAWCSASPPRDGGHCRRASPISPPRTTRWWCSPTRARSDSWRPAGRRSAASRPSR